MILENFSETMFLETLVFVEFAFSKVIRLCPLNFPVLELVFWEKKSMWLENYEQLEGQQAKNIPQECVWFKKCQLSNVLFAQ